MPPASPARRLDEIDREVSVHALDPHWRNEIDAASSEEALIALARRFMQRMPSIFVARLPEVAPLPRLTDAGDVSLVTYRLRRAFCSAALDDAHVAPVGEALAFFDALSERIFDLRS